MSQQPPTRDATTFQASLETVARLGEGYLLEGAGDELTASELLNWLHAFQPQALGMPVHLVLPDQYTLGAFYGIGPQGEVLAALPLYRIERRIRNVLHMERRLAGGPHRRAAASGGTRENAA